MISFEHVENLIDKYIAEELRPVAEKMKADMVAAVHDKRFPLAVQLIVDTNSCTTSQFQKKFRIGYGKAAIFIDVMEALGMVSKIRAKSNSTKIQQRQILPPAKVYLEQLFN